MMAKTSRGNDAINSWSSFKKIFNRVYSPEEDRVREIIFLENLNLIRNEKNSSTIFGVTPFADLSPREFAKKFERRQISLGHFKLHDVNQNG